MNPSNKLVTYLKLDKLNPFDLEKAVFLSSNIDPMLETPISHDQFDAIFHFAYTEGLQELEKSEIVNLLNNSKLDSMIDAFKDNPGDRGLNFLTGKRRKRLVEICMFKLGKIPTVFHDDWDVKSDLSTIDPHIIKFANKYLDGRIPVEFFNEREYFI